MNTLPLLYEQDILEGECKCESLHHPALPPCSIAVVARKYTCGAPFNICAASRDWNLQELSKKPRSLCDACDQAIEDCWRIIPI